MKLELLVTATLAGVVLWTLGCSSGTTGGNPSALGAPANDAGGVDGAKAAADGALSADGGHAAEGDASGAPPGSLPVPGAKRIFITRKRLQGNLGGGGGLAGADAVCNEAAESAQLGGSWTAWLSTPSANAIDRVADVGPWYDTAGAMIFADKANLATSPVSALWKDEMGASLASDRIWTGTQYGGTFNAALGDKSCAGWTSSGMAEGAQIGQVGRQDGAAWTAQSSTTCDQQAHLICLER